MKAYVCSVCGFVSLKGDAPEKCPVCGAPKSAFSEKEDALKEPKDPRNLSELEKKHIPVIVLPKTCGLIPDGCRDVHVKIGEITHPMLPEHFIMRLDFYLNKEFIARVMLRPGALNPAAALHLKVSNGKLSVVEFCNLHGAWMSEVDL